MENTDDQVVKEELFELMIQAISSDFFHDAISILEPMMLIIDKQLVEPDQICKIFFPVNAKISFKQNLDPY